MLKMQKYIVIGAGILGASTAYYLAKSGHDVTVIDRNDLGQATDAGAGMINPWVAQRRNKAWYALAKGGTRIYPQLVKELEEDGETDTGYAKVGALSIHSDVEKLNIIQERVLKRREDAPEIGEVTLLDEKQTKEIFPLIADGYRALHIAGGGRVDGRKMREALLRAARKHGATIYYGEASLAIEGSRVIGASIGDETFHADQVILTAGAWISELLKPLGIESTVFPQKGQILHVKLPGMDTGKFPVAMLPTNKYILSFDDHIALGSTQESNQGFDLQTTAGGLHTILSGVMDIVPKLKESILIESRVGFRPVIPKSFNIIGALPGLEGLILANGLGSSGLTTGPFVGKQLANLALGQELEIDLENYPLSNGIK